MDALSLAVFLCLAAIATASFGPHGGAVVSGPSGVVTSHGAIGPAGPDNGLAYGAYGHGLGYGHGLYGDVALAAPVTSAVVAGHGLGYGGLGYGAGLGYGGYGHGLGYGYEIGHGYGYGHDGGVAVGYHGVTVQGPPTAPAVVAGPSGKIVADGLWGPTSHRAHGAHGDYGW